MKTLRFIFMIMLCLFLVACANKKDDLEISSEERLQQVLTENNYLIVDVRTAEEYQESHIKHAVNIPYDQIDDQVKLDKEKTILVYCRSGRRSAIAEQALTSYGFEVLDLGAFETIPLEKE